MKGYLSSVTVWGVLVFVTGTLMNYFGVDPIAAEELSGELTQSTGELVRLAGEVMAALGLRRAVGTGTMIKLGGSR